MAPFAGSLDDTVDLQNHSAHEQASGLRPGIYVPTVAFFDRTEEVDINTTKKHAQMLAEAGVAGIVTHGSNGEAVHLDHDERSIITRATREALDSVGYSDIPVIAGCGAQSTREAIRLCKEAALAGATYALVLPPSYYASLLDSELILNHFRTIANASPIPLLIYNFPGATPGIDLTSDQILELASNPRIQGVKLTCGNTGKLARIAASAPPGFLVMGGSADFLLQTLSVKGHGVIAGLANLAPTLCVRTMDAYKAGDMEKAQELQAVLARGDWEAIKGGFLAVKKALGIYQGYHVTPRQPFTAQSGPSLKALQRGFQEMMELEVKLQA